MVVSARLSPAEGRRFAFTVGLAFLAVAGVAWWRGRLIVPVAAGGLGTALLLAGLLIPAHLDPVYRGWMSLAHAIARVTTPITLRLIYYVVLTPIGVTMRALGRNPLTLHHKPDTAWISRGAHRRSDLERQF